VGERDYALFIVDLKGAPAVRYLVSPGDGLFLNQSGRGKRELLGREGNMVNPNKALWEKGDFTEIAAFMRRSGEAVVASIGITPPLRALDLGCGDGTTAVPLARRGADVVGIDIAKNLVEAGNKTSG
jgi:SAM-dependent methyltransferase